MKKSALILIDLQNDFCPGGNLAVTDGDKIVPIANDLQQHFDIVIATQDWHPEDHLSFAVNHPDRAVGDYITLNNMEQILWPAHCIQGSSGAKLFSQLHTEKIQHIFHKGIDKQIDSYSAFFDNAHLRATGLGDCLKELHVEDVYLMGIATDYCVKYSSLDAIQLGFNVHVIIDGCKGIEKNEGDINNALAEMQAAGVKLILAKDVRSSSQPAGCNNDIANT